MRATFTLVYPVSTNREQWIATCRAPNPSGPDQAADPNSCPIGPFGLPVPGPTPGWRARELVRPASHLASALALDATPMPSDTEGQPSVGKRRPDQEAVNQQTREQVRRSIVAELLAACQAGPRSAPLRELGPVVPGRGGRQCRWGSLSSAGRRRRRLWSRPGGPCVGELRAVTLVALRQQRRS
jgi:hypothetical protein